MTLTATLNASAFARAALMVSKDQTRYYLHGVHVEPCNSGPGALMVATDGTALVVIHDPDAHVTGSGIVALPPALLKACSSKQADKLEISNGSATVAGMSANGVLMDGTFPYWRGIMLTHDMSEPCVGAFDSKYIATLGKALNTGNSAFIRLSGTAGNPHWVRGSDPYAIGVIMPVIKSGSGADILSETRPAFIA